MHDPTKTMQRRKTRIGWLTLFIILLILDYTVPYTILRSTPKLYGAFLFYIGFVLAAMGAMFAIFMRWRD